MDARNEWLREQIAFAIFISSKLPHVRDSVTLQTIAGNPEVIAAIRRHADRIEATLNAYGAGAFRKRVAQMPAPRHPFEVEPALLSLLRDDSIDEISIHGVRFIRDASRAFVQAN